MTPEQRFWPKVEKSDGCWLWTSSTSGRGYGAFWANGGRIRAHRFSWELHNGSIPAGLWVLHHCDTPACVRPEHLFLGDRRANMLDAAKKGRICTIGKSRTTHRVHGHPLTAANTHRNSLGHRSCQQCRHDRNAARPTLGVPHSRCERCGRYMKHERGEWICNCMEKEEGV